MDTGNKPLKVLWCINTLSEIDSQPYPSHLVHAYRMGRDTNVEFILYTPRRMAIATARNSAVEYALKNNCDYVFFSDDDMELHPWTFSKLLERNKDIIMAMCYIRGYPFRPMVFKWYEEEGGETSIADQRVRGKKIGLWLDCEEHADETGLINNVAAVGCAATLIKTEVFKMLDYPWFYTGTANTEDVYFCMKVHNKIEGAEIAVDTTCPAGHVLRDRRVLYPWNAELLRKHEEEYNELIRERNAQLIDSSK